MSFEMYIYNMIPTPSGKLRGDIHLATAVLVPGGVRIECYDEKLKGKLEEIFSIPIIRRAPTGKHTGIISHRDEAVQPFTEEFFHEVLFILHKHNLSGILPES